MDPGVRQPVDGYVLGTAFDLRQALDTLGAFAGPTIAILAMWASADDFRLVFWIATIPALLAVLLILVGILKKTGYATAVGDEGGAFMRYGLIQVRLDHGKYIML
ncbi:MAG: hypothetical protein JXQ84_09630 [Rhodospirillaceae bacterium]|nr:hypothetical protein [Rhodospirillaceae bacterium]